MAVPRIAMLIILSTTIAAVCSRPVGAQGWGHIEGQIVFEGNPFDPKVRIPRAASTAEVIIGTIEHFLDESLVIDPETKGVANVFVYLPRIDDLDPEFREPPKQPVQVTLKDARFAPHAAFIRTGQPVLVKSRDPFPHEMHLRPFINHECGFLVRAKDRKGVTLHFPEPEKWPIQVKCDLHPHMKSYWLVLNHPYAAVTDSEGRFRVEHLPAGEHLFVVWHSRAAAGYLDAALEVTVKADATTELGKLSFRSERFSRFR